MITVIVLSAELDSTGTLLLTYIMIRIIIE